MSYIDREMGHPSALNMGMPLMMLYKEKLMLTTRLHTITTLECLPYPNMVFMVIWPFTLLCYPEKSTNHLFYMACFVLESPTILRTLPDIICIWTFGTCEDSFYIPFENMHLDQYQTILSGNKSFFAPRREGDFQGIWDC